MQLLADDNPRILACGTRYGVDLVREGETFKIRSARLMETPNYHDARRRNNPPNFFTTQTRDVLRIAIAPDNIRKDFGFSSRDEAVKAARLALTHAVDHEVTIPIIVERSHAYWGRPLLMTHDKMDFQIVDADEVAPTVTPVAEESVVALPVGAATTALVSATTAPTTAPPTAPPTAPSTAPPTAPVVVSSVVAEPDPKRRRVVRTDFETVTYNGTRFDDDDEARHAYLLDLLGLRYRVQPCLVESPLLLSNGNTTGVYRTDFYVEGIGYLETTGGEPSARKIFACELLARKAHAEGRAVYLIWGGMHPPQRDTYESSPRAMRIVKFLVEEHTFANGATQLEVAPDHGYAWVLRDGTPRIEKLGSTLNRAWAHPTVRDAIAMARDKVF